MHPLHKCFILLAFPLLLAQTSQKAPAPSRIDNPLYALWSKATPGASLTFEATITTGKESRPGPAIVLRLLNVTPEEITLEFSSAAGPGEHQNLTVAARIDPAEIPLFFLPPEQRGIFSLKDSSATPEKLTIEGKPVDSTCYAATVEMPVPAGAPSRNMSIKIWLAPSLPVFLNKIEITQSPRPGLPTRISSLVATAWDAPSSRPATTRPRE